MNRAGARRAPRAPVPTAASSGQHPGQGQQPSRGHGPGRPVLRLERADAVLFGLDGVLADAAGRRQAAGLLRELRAVSVPAAVVSASRRCAQVLAAAGLDRLTDVVVDG